ncbi:unnamed protein product [Camellia sinensis]
MDDHFEEQVVTRYRTNFVKVMVTLKSSRKMPLSHQKIKSETNSTILKEMNKKLRSILKEMKNSKSETNSTILDASYPKTTTKYTNTKCKY